MNNEKLVSCEHCCELLPDYEWLDINNKQQVDMHVSECFLCNSKKEMILGNFSAAGDDKNELIGKIDFTNEIMAKITSPQKVARNPFVLQFLGLAVGLELIFIFFTGFSSIVELSDIINQFYQDVVGMVFPLMEESLSIFEETGYYSLSAEYLPAGTNTVLLLVAFFIASALYIISRKRSTYYESK